MICLIGLIIFSILGIFSATRRELAKEAFGCVFRRITFRPCDTGFNEKIKAKIIGKLLGKNLKIAKFTNQYFEIISWFFVLLFFTSLIFSARGVYNLIRYQNCDPKNPQNCILTPKQQEKCQCEKGKVTCKNSKENPCPVGECDNCDACDK